MGISKGVGKMSNQVVTLAQVEAGQIVDEDVFANSLFPIVRKDTALTAIHMEVLKTFSINGVKVKNEYNVPRETIIEDEEVQPVIVKEKIVFQRKYELAVQGFKKEFSKWRAGITPDVAQIRSIIVLLLEQLEESGENLRFLTGATTKKDYIYHHSISVSLLSFKIARKMSLTKGEAVQLAIAGALIDCGMAKISPTILNKTNRLTDKEHIEIKKHPVYSYQMVKDTPLLKTEMKLAVLQHHERLDGSGYPLGEKNKNITPYAQVLSIADVYHARISDRVYRSREPIYRVLESFKEDYEKFDLQAINALYEVVGNLSIGTKVQLSNGKQGTVIYLHPDEPFRPSVQVPEDATIIDLTKERHLIVERTL